jgi:peptidoglycan/xylan/chitin deacetylase (PgdA/CDA1 family)
MRLAVAACAVAIALFVGVFGYLVVNKAELSSGQPAAPPVLASAESSPVTRTVVAVAEPAQAPARVVEAAPVAAAPRVEPARPAPVETSVTIAQRTPAAEQSFAQLPAFAAAAKQAPAAAPTATPAAAPPAAAARAAAACPGNPNALGVARTVEIDTTGGPGFGQEHFRQHDFLEPGEVVLTFDDGPWPQRTLAVARALASHCARAIFFPIGKHATYEPGILKQLAAAGHSIGSHTWSHQNLANKTVEEGKAEIEKGISAVAMSVGGPVAPFFRFPALRHPPELVEYLGTRNVGIFSTDMDSFDFKMRRPEQVRQAVLAKLKKFGKGIVLMHDFQQATAAAATDLMNDLKAHGYKIVHMRPKFPITTLAQYDDEVRRDVKLPTVSSRPTSSVVRTVD